MLTDGPHMGSMSINADMRQLLSSFEPLQRAVLQQVPNGFDFGLIAAS
jgi:hypothetical protein